MSWPERTVESVSGSFGMLQRLIYAARSGELALTTTAMLSRSFILFHHEMCPEQTGYSEPRDCVSVPMRESSGAGSLIPIVSRHLAHGCHEYTRVSEARTEESDDWHPWLPRYGRTVYRHRLCWLYARQSVHADSGCDSLRVFLCRHR